MVEQRVDGHTLLTRAFQGFSINTNFGGDIQEATTAFQLASKNATLDEIFGCAQVLFPGLYALTIEGGHCKRPPKVQYFREEVGKRPTILGQPYILPPSEGTFESRILSLSMPGFRSLAHRPMPPPANANHPYFPLPSRSGTNPRLPILPNTKTLILKGAWNTIRAHSDFAALASALPSLREFHCTYHKPKTMAYATMCEALRIDFPPTITHINLCLEGLYTKNASSLKKWRKLYPARHICRSLGAVAPQLESLTYTGRVCGALFTTAVDAAEATRGSCTRLKTIDIVVNNVCRDPSCYNDGTGIHNWPFIQAFEALVLQAVRSLDTYTGVKSMRIRFIDLDSPAPLLNPMFHLEDDRAWGIYSDKILRTLMDVRPNVQFSIPSDDAVGVGDRVPPSSHHTGTHRVMSVDYYKAVAHTGVLM